MKKLKVKKGSTCMACLACVGACSEAFYKVFDPDKACLQIVEKKAVRPIACPQCGKCAEACPEGAITQNAKGVYMINKKIGIPKNLFVTILSILSEIVNFSFGFSTVVEIIF